MSDGVPMRYSHRSNVFLVRLVGVALLVLALAGGLGARSPRADLPFVVGVYIGLGFWALFCVTALVSYRGRWYRVHGSTLVIRGLRWRRIDMRAVSACTVRVWSRYGKSSSKIHRYLDMRIDGLWIRFGDSTTPSYFRPEGLLALAEALDRSPVRRVRENAAWLRKLARRPDIRSWPERQW